MIQGVHESMLDAGAEVLETDTFQASRLKLEEWGLGEHTPEINRKAAEIARAAAGEDRFVAGSIGPTGHLPASDDPTLGKITFGELVEVFTEQAQGLIEGGADLLIIETAQDILEVKAAIFGAREAFKLTGRQVPIQTSVSLLPNGGKMLLGTDIQAVLTTLTVARRGRDRAQLLDRPRGHARRDPLPRREQPAAGALHPERRPPAPGARTARRSSPRSPTRWRTCSRSSWSATASPSSAAAAARRPTTSRRSSTASAAATWRRGPATRETLVSSMMTATPLAQEPRPTLVGERVNSQGSRKAKELLLADDYDGILQIAEDQVTGGAHVLDVCVALTERQDEAEQMREVVKRDLAHAARADPDRLHRARRDPGRARAHPRPRDRQLDQPRGRAATSSTSSCRSPRRTAPR